MKEWEKHLERAEEKLRSANLLFENNMQTTREKADYDIYYELSKEDAEKFLDRIKRALEELKR